MNVNPSGSLLNAAILHQASTNVLSKVQDVQKTQGEATVAAITAAGDEAEQSPDGDERGGGFQAIA